MAVGNRVNVDIIRDGREQTFMVAIGALPSRPPPKPEREDRRAERWGMTVTDISPEIVRRFRLEAGREGVVVIAIERDSSAARAGIQVGDVIEEVNRQPIRSLEDFEIAAAAASDSDRILIFSRRGDTSLFRVLRQRD
jgi:serine protease Do